jgi:hypothetical protein
MLLTDESLPLVPFPPLTPDPPAPTTTGYVPDPSAENVPERIPPAPPPLPVYDAEEPPPAPPPAIARYSTSLFAEPAVKTKSALELNVWTLYEPSVVIEPPVAEG